MKRRKPIESHEFILSCMTTTDLGGRQPHQLALHERCLLGQLARVSIKCPGHSKTPDIHDEVGSGDKDDGADGKDFEHGVGLERLVEAFLHALTYYVSCENLRRAAEIVRRHVVWTGRLQVSLRVHGRANKEGTCNGTKAEHRESKSYEIHRGEQLLPKATYFPFRDSQFGTLTCTPSNSGSKTRKAQLERPSEVTCSISIGLHNSTPWRAG